MKNPLCYDNVQLSHGKMAIVLSITKMKQIFFSPELVEEKGPEVLTDLLEELGGWPVLGDFYGVKWDSTTFNLTHLILGLLKYNNRVLMDLYSSTDSKNTSARILFVSTQYTWLYILSDCFDGPNDAKVNSRPYLNHNLS